MKRIRFDLPIDGEKVSSIEELQKHFTTEIIGHFRSGVLERWLESRRDSTFLPEVRKLAGNDEARSDDAVALRELCRIFEVEADEATIEAAVAKPTGVPGMGLRTQRPHTRKEFLDWFVATTHSLSRLVSPRSGIPDFRRAHLGFGLPDAPASADPGELSAYVVEFINHCRGVVEALRSCPDRVFAQALAAHVSDQVDCVLDGIDGMTREEFDGVAAEVHVEDVQLPIRMEPVRHHVRTPGRMRISDLRWTSEGAIENAGDYDVWCFTVLRPGEVTVETNGDLDTTIGVLLLDCSFDEIDFDDHSFDEIDDADGRLHSNFKIVRTLDPGTYFIYVVTGETPGGYTLDVRHSTRHAGTDSRDDPELSTASLAINHSISRARAIAGRYWQEVLRSLSKEHPREFEDIFDDPDMSEAHWSHFYELFNLSRLTDEQRAELGDDDQALLETLHETWTRIVRRIGDTGLPASGTDTAMHDDT